jgi:hypothetical protein
MLKNVISFEDSERNLPKDIEEFSKLYLGKKLFIYQDEEETLTIGVAKLIGIDERYGNLKLEYEENKVLNRYNEYDDDEYSYLSIYDGYDIFEYNKEIVDQIIENIRISNEAWEKSKQLKDTLKKVVIKKSEHLSELLSKNQNIYPNTY